MWKLETTIELSHMIYAREMRFYMSHSQRSPVSLLASNILLKYADFSDFG